MTQPAFVYFVCFVVSPSSRQRHVQLRRPRRERGQDAGVQFDALRELFCASPDSGCTGEPHALESRPRRRGPAVRRHLLGLPPKRLRAAIAGRIHHLHEHGRAPPFTRVRPPVAREPAGERLDQQRERIALVTVVDAARRQQRACRARREKGRSKKSRAQRVSPSPPSTMTACTGIFPCRTEARASGRVDPPRLNALPVADFRGGSG